MSLEVNSLWSFRVGPFRQNITVDRISPQEVVCSVQRTGQRLVLPRTDFQRGGRCEAVEFRPMEHRHRK